jgi:hypothetical protein
MPKYDDFGHLPIPLVLRGKPKMGEAAYLLQHMLTGKTGLIMVVI